MVIACAKYLLRGAAWPLVCNAAVYLYFMSPLREKKNAWMFEAEAAQAQDDERDQKRKSLFGKPDET